MADKINFPWIPDMVHYTAYKFNLCVLCKEAKRKNEKVDNTNCPHFKGETRMMHVVYTPTNSSLLIDAPETTEE